MTSLAYACSPLQPLTARLKVSDLTFPIIEKVSDLTFPIIESTSANRVVVEELRAVSGMMVADTASIAFTADRSKTVTASQHAALLRLANEAGIPGDALHRWDMAARSGGDLKQVTATVRVAGREGSRVPWMGELRSDGHLFLDAIRNRRLDEVRRLAAIWPIDQRIWGGLPTPLEWAIATGSPEVLQILLSAVPIPAHLSSKQIRTVRGLTLGQAELLLRIGGELAQMAFVNVPRLQDATDQQRAEALVRHINRSAGLERPPVGGALRLALTDAGPQTVGVLASAATTEELHQLTSPRFSAHSWELVEALIANGRIGQVFPEGENALLMLADIIPAPVAFDLFARTANTAVQRSAVFSAARLGRTDLLRGYASLGFDVRIAPLLLHVAAREAHLETVRFLIDSGISPNTRNQKNETVLHILAQRLSGIHTTSCGIVLGQSPFDGQMFPTRQEYGPLVDRQVAVIRTLRKAGADIAAKDAEGRVSSEILAQHARSSQGYPEDVLLPWREALTARP